MDALIGAIDLVIQELRSKGLDEFWIAGWLWYKERAEYLKANPADHAGLVHLLNELERLTSPGMGSLTEAGDPGALRLAEVVRSLLRRI